LKSGSEGHELKTRASGRSHELKTRASVEGPELKTRASVERNSISLVFVRQFFNHFLKNLAPIF